VTADLINLRRVKKNLARSEAEKRADANRVKFGRSKSEKTVTKIEIARREKKLDGKKREDKWPKI
jgi:Domain of unknown function (DUF4169)